VGLIEGELGFWDMRWQAGKASPAPRVIILLVALFIAAIPVPLPASAAPPIEFKHSQLALITGQGRYEFNVELAQTTHQLAQGLQERRNLAPSAGMLFDFNRVDYVAMWMKNTHISLDMLFLLPDGRIDSIAERTRPLSLAQIKSKRPVRAVLELNAGTAARLGIKVGDRVLHRIFGNFSN